MSNYADVLGSLEGGKTLDQINDTLADMVSAVTMHRKVGELQVTIKITPNGDNAVSVVAAVKAKVPEAAKGMTVFFSDEHGTLLRRNPNQPELPLRQVSEPERTNLKQA